jgi:acyl carrier protein
MNRADYLDLIRRYFHDQGFELNAETDLFESGAIDSMMIIELVVFLEKRLDISFDAAKMITDNFRTIDAIINLIEDSYG